MTDYIIEALIRTSIIITNFKYSNFDNLKICNKIYRI
mgnify:CR=1 FL=1